jgi:hypothetical protein
MTNIFLWRIIEGPDQTKFTVKEITLWSHGLCEVSKEQVEQDRLRQVIGVVSKCDHITAHPSDYLEEDTTPPVVGAAPAVHGQSFIFRDDKHFVRKGIRTIFKPCDQLWVRGVVRTASIANDIQDRYLLVLGKGFTPPIKQPQELQAIFSTG